MESKMEDLKNLPGIDKLLNLPEVKDLLINIRLIWLNILFVITIDSGQERCS